MQVLVHQTYWSNTDFEKSTWLFPRFMGFISLLHPHLRARRSTYMATRCNKIRKLIWLKSNSEGKELFFNCIDTMVHHRNYTHTYICASTRGGALWGRKWAAEGTIALLCLAAGPSYGILECSLPQNFTVVQLPIRYFFLCPLSLWSVPIAEKARIIPYHEFYRALSRTRLWPQLGHEGLY